MNIYGLLAVIPSARRTCTLMQKCGDPKRARSRAEGKEGLLVVQNHKKRCWVDLSVRIGCIGFVLYPQVLDIDLPISLKTARTIFPNTERTLQHLQTLLTKATMVFRWFSDLTLKSTTIFRPKWLKNYTHLGCINLYMEFVLCPPPQKK